MPHSKENNFSSVFVVVDTHSILKGKNAAPVSNVPPSVTVSAVPPLPIKVMPKHIPRLFLRVQTERATTHPVLTQPVFQILLNH
jgi:hypothetical protein